MVLFYSSFIRVLFFCLAVFAAEAKPTQSICLNMIVKDESAVICRCLASVKPFIDYWVIVDTGSTDGTQELIREFMKDIPGELHESYWVDFAHNRNEALILARDKGDYLLFIDADEILKFPTGYELPELDLDFYYVMTEFGGMKYPRVQLVNNHLNWKWAGILHEAVVSDEAKNSGKLAGITNFVTTEGNRSQDPEKFFKDIKVLENAVEAEPENARYVFYLAQSYRDANQYDRAIKTYEKRVSMGGWDQEIFWSLLQVALLQEALAMPEETVIEGYLSAHNYLQSRVEPLYHLVYRYRINEEYEKGYEVGREALLLKSPEEFLFLEPWIYDYGLLLEFSICAYWTEHYVESMLASYLILKCPDLPQHVLSCVEMNLCWMEGKVKSLPTYSLQR
ncbi:MAG: glycosyltransferase family 2 protein [Chlamydiae bacterium]|nr:glycosyltransferase family 2 protein [Chlamydiota bacterium]